MDLLQKLDIKHMPEKLIYILFNVIAPGKQNYGTWLLLLSMEYNRFVYISLYISTI